MQFLTKVHRFARGESYWKAILTSGRELSEVQLNRDTSGKHRPIRWLEDIVSSGDGARIAELWLCTPQGEAALRIFEPYTAYQFNQNVTTLKEGTRRIAQIVGRVDNKETGQGIAFIWDTTTQTLYKDDQASVLAFHAWRPGIAPIGALSLDVIGVRL
jgi:hypothetical protein